MSFANDGISVLKLPALSSLYFTSFLNSPWIVSPSEEISLTLPAFTWAMKVGV